MYLKYYPSLQFLPSVALGALLTPNSISCDSGTSAPLQSNPPMGCTSSTTHRWIFHVSDTSVPLWQEIRSCYPSLPFLLGVAPLPHHSDKKLGRGDNRGGGLRRLGKLGRGSSGRLLLCALSLYSLNSLSPPRSSAAPYSLNLLYSLNIYPLLPSFCTPPPKKSAFYYET